MADYPKASKELQEEQLSQLGLIATQLVIANSQAGPTKDEFQKTNTELLKEMMEGTEEVEEQTKVIKKTEEKKEKQQNFMAKLFGKIVEFNDWSKDFQERAAKLAQRAGSKVKDFGKAQVDMLKSAAKGLFDLLLTGLGLLALWKLFDWLSKQDWEQIYEDVQEWVGKIRESWSNFIGGLENIWTLSTRLGAVIGIEKINKMFTGREGKITKNITNMMRRIRIFFFRLGRIKLPNSTKMLRSLTGKGSLFAKLGNIFTKISTLFSKIPGVAKILSFVKGAAKFLGRIFVPVTVIMALWEAVSGFMDGFGETEGNFFQKMLGGIGGALKGLLDFFVFGIAEMVQDAIVWLLELFGFDSAAVAVGDFNLVGRIKDAVFKAIDYVTELFSFRDTSFEGIAKSLVDILMLPLNLAINFLKDLFGWGEPDEPFKFSTFVIDTWNTVVTWVKGLFAWSAEAGATEDGGWTLTNFISGIWTAVKEWITGIFAWGTEKAEEWGITSFVMGVYEDVKAWISGIFSWASEEDESDSFIVKTVKNAITGAKEWLGKLFKFDSTSDIIASAFNAVTFFPNLVKDALLTVTEYLLDLFGFGEEAKKVANAKEFSIGDMIMNVVTSIVEWFEQLFNLDIGKIFSDALGALGEAGKKILSFFDFGDDEVKETKVKGSARGGLLKAGEYSLVGEEGPELIRMGSVAGKVIPNKESMGMMSAPTIINAPTTTNSNVSTSPTSVVMGVSSTDPNKALLSY